MLSFESLVKRLWPSAAYSVPFLGLDFSGKTSLLYYIKFEADVITPIPSIGMNVESLPLRFAKGDISLTGYDISAGCGGPRFARQMARFYLPASAAVIWVVDSSDRKRLEESVEDFEYIMHFLQEFHLTQIPVILLAHKSDLPNTIPVDELRRMFWPHCKNHPFAIFPTTCRRPYKDSGVPVVLAWLYSQIQASELLGKHSEGQSSTKSEEQEVKEMTTYSGSTNKLARRLEDFLTRAESDSTPETFLQQFRELNLPAWDHYTHIRLAYVILTTYGRQKGKNMIFDGLQHYIANSKQATGRAFHFTMTYFWIQIVHFGIRSSVVTSSEAPSPHNDSSTTLTSVSDASTLVDTPGVVTASTPSTDDFFRFLLINPYVVDGNLWTDYYSKDVMMSPKAKEEMVLPDKKPLPSLLVRDTIRR
ncbi:hypothetical protein JAAARDRAFT_236805 [Jaapia argillacea MUCL 33604]|uniref:Uncharacterized protein n=1 Tax=Jaapia argillacea MUCL 33604 TaxID=933084 RepID=A0A067QMI1_9AGAM|nr:hypothetical protein JAAARDRAFT_236805 [Jaapia argillacea MUCL 33604]